MRVVLPPPSNRSVGRGTFLNLYCFFCLLFSMFAIQFCSILQHYFAKNCSWLVTSDYCTLRRRVNVRTAAATAAKTTTPIPTPPTSATVLPCRLYRARDQKLVAPVRRFTPHHASPAHHCTSLSYPPNPKPKSKTTNEIKPTRITASET